MLRISDLERLCRDLGNAEARSIVMKIGVPVTTVVYFAAAWGERASGRHRPTCTPMRVCFVPLSGLSKCSNVRDRTIIIQ
jgi:hypothetical protein